MTEAPLPSDIPESAYGGMRFDPERHFILENCLWVANIRQTLNEPDLFVYLHKVHGTYVLAKWAVPPSPTQQGWMLELDVLYGHPDHIEFKYLPTFIWLRNRLQLHTKVMKRVKELIRQKNEALLRAKDDARRQCIDMGKHAAKKAGIHKGTHPMIQLMKAGGVPFSTPELVEARTGQKIDEGAIKDAIKEAKRGS